jgi:hypothetical protein
MLLALDLLPVVIQMPDFGKGFWAMPEARPISPPSRGKHKRSSMIS